MIKKITKKNDEDSLGLLDNISAELIENNKGLENLRNL